MEIHIEKKLLHFKKPSGTSRGILYDKPSWILSLRLSNARTAYGECSVIPGLSPDFTDENQYEQKLVDLKKEVESDWSEEEFKQAFLAMQLRDAKERETVRRNLEQSKLNVFALQAGMGASSNFRNFSDLMISSQANKNFFNDPMLALTNPFAWINFIKSVKNGDLKKKDYKKAYEFLPKENLNRQMFLRNLKSN